MRYVIVFMTAAMTLRAQAPTYGGVAQSGAVIDSTGAARTAPVRVSSGAPGGACALGDVYFRSDSPAGQNLYFCTSANTWSQMSGGGSSYALRDLMRESSGTVDVRLHDPRFFWIKDEFNGHACSTSAGSFCGSGWLLSNYSGAGLTMGDQSASWPNLGVLRLATGAASGNNSSLSLRDYYSQLGELLQNSNRRWESYFTFKFPSAGDYASTDLYVLFGNSFGGGLAGEGFGIRYLGGTDTAFMFVSRTGSADTVLTTGVSVDTAWHTLRIFSDAMNGGSGQSKVWVQMDGGAAKSICSSGCDVTVVPSASAKFQPGWFLRTNSAAAKSLHLDFFGFFAEVGTAPHRRN